MENTNSRNETILNIQNTLKKMGYNYYALKDKDKEHLIKIDESIQEIFRKEKEAKETLSRSTVSTKGISKDTGISRQTFYNNPILNEYIDYYAKQFKKVDMSEIQKDSNEKIKELQEQLDKLHRRDIQFEKMKLEIEELKAAIKERDEVIESLRNNKPTVINFRNKGK